MRAPARFDAGSGVITLIVDEDVPVIQLVKGLTAVGLTLSNIDGWTFRLHRMKSAARVIDLAERRRRDTATDAQIRDGLHSLFDPPQPGAT